MSTRTHMRTLALGGVVQPMETEDRFAERRRIAIFERDPALRPVIIRTLLRLGCVVSPKGCVEALKAALLEGPIDGAIAAFDGDETMIHTLLAANRFGVPIVLLTDDVPEPWLAAFAPRMRFVQKPFDMRDLLANLQLPEHAKLIKTSIQ